jgi:hypothetical protein
MLALPKEFASTTDRTDEPALLPASAAPPAGAPTTEVLISTSEVVFSTATALGARRATIGDRFVAVMRRTFAASPNRDRTRPQGHAHGDAERQSHRYYYLEQALLAREMTRL